MVSSAQCFSWRGHLTFVTLGHLTRASHYCYELLQEPETRDWPGQRGEGAVQSGYQTGRPPQGPGAEAGQTEQGDRGARGHGQEEADAGDPGQANM